MLIKACLNGSRAPGEHPAVPRTPAELAAAARACVDAGAGALHLHPHGADGRQSLRADDVGAAVRAVRAACPGTPLGTTTLALIEPDPATRLRLIRQWRELPDFVSVNLAEDGIVAICGALLDMGVGIEPGLAGADDARRLVASGLGRRCLRILLEPEETTAAAALASAEAAERVLDEAGVTAPRLLHGFDATAWPLLAEAARRNLDMRIGLEDALLLPDGRAAPDNAALVVAARAIAWPGA